MYVLLTNYVLYLCLAPSNFLLKYFTIVLQNYMDPTVITATSVTVLFFH